MTRRQGLALDRTIRIVGAPGRVQAAFFDAKALAAWWRVIRSVTTPRPLGIYAVEWASTPFRGGAGEGADAGADATGGVFYGTVVEFHPGRRAYVAEAYWLPASSDPLGPMGLEITCRVDGPATVLRIRQHSADHGARWAYYEELIAGGWDESLDALKRYIEAGAAPRLPPHGTARR